MRIVGLSGGIAAGKSTVAAIFSSYDNIEIIDADVLARESLQVGTTAFKQVLSHFGQGILTSNGEMDRKILASIVFKDQSALGVLNQITHKAIHVKLREKVTALNNKIPGVLILYDAPLIFETGVYQKLQKNILVTVEQKIQIKRLQQFRGYSINECLERIQNQMSQEDKILLADYIIDNNGNLEKTKQQIATLVPQLKILPEKKVQDFF